MAKDYEIVPEQDFDSLKEDIDKIKKDPIGSSREGKDLKESIDNLNISINNLFNLFKTSADDLKAEEHDNQIMSQKIGPLFEQVKSLTEQNEKIAKGIVALAEMVEELKYKQDKPMPRQEIPPTYSKQNTNDDMFSSSQSQSYRPQFNQPMMEEPSFEMGPQPLPRTEVPEMPSPPQQKSKKKSLFGF